VIFSVSIVQDTISASDHGDNERFPADRAMPLARFFFRDPNGYIFEVVDAGRLSEA
jgi:hypothetical protein